ncbi:hypothetical protein GC163_03305 [bacterium]|nr:hypothetical protein [bacterium]
MPSARDLLLLLSGALTPVATLLAGPFPFESDLQEFMPTADLSLQIDADSVFHEASSSWLHAPDRESPEPRDWWHSDDLIVQLSAIDDVFMDLAEAPCIVTTETQFSPTMETEELPESADDFEISVGGIDFDNTAFVWEKSPQRRRRVSAAYVQWGRVMRVEVREPGQGRGVFGPGYRSRSIQPRPRGAEWELASGIAWREFLYGESYARRFRDTTLGLRWDLTKSTQLHLIYTRSLFEVTEEGDPVNRGLGLRTEWKF